MSTLAALLDGVPSAPQVAAATLAQLADTSVRVLVVLDDDPTGTQSVADLPVLTSWTVESLVWALSQGKPAVYVMTNSRSLDPADAEERNREVARNSFAAASQIGVDVVFVSRSDSTLRGHFPLEPRVLAEEVRAATGESIDGVIIVPAFPDAGRITIGGTHYARAGGGEFVPAGESEFARDATFGYRSSDLRAWVEEKTGGKVAAADVASIDLSTLRTDPERTIFLLRALHGERPLVVDIVDENDLRLLCVALHRAEEQGSRFIYRSGPPFPRAYIGQEPRPPLSPDEVRRLRAGGLAEDAVGGLIVVGSHVALTTSQLNRLLERHHPVLHEIDVPTILGSAGEEHVGELAAQVANELAEGNVVVRTSRALVTGTSRDDSLAISRRVSAAVVSLVRQVLACRAPRFVVAKGGITSSDVAALGLSIDRAFVRGPMLPGIVSLWEPMDGPARGIPFIVFAGNVGGPDSLADVVDILSTTKEQQ